MKTQPKFGNVIEQLARRHSVSVVFSDFMFVTICALSMGRMEKEYMETIARYTPAEVTQMAQALALLTEEMTGDGEGMIDVLGAFFEEHISHGHNGQFFTPQPVCDMMAQITCTPKPGETVFDPACGSGRTLLAVGKLNRWAWFYGADIDRNCAMMTAINLQLNALCGEVAWMDSLANRYFGGWAIEPTWYGVPFIRPITEAESYIHMKIRKEPMVAPAAPASLPEPVVELPKRGEQLMFDF